MYPAPFDYAQAESLSHALELLAEHGPDARPLAGGMSLIPLMKLRLAQPQVLVDLGRLRELGGVKADDGTLVIGAMTRHVDVEGSALVRDRLPLVHDAVGVIGDVQVRNRGTVGGSLAEADPAGDWGPVLLALNGRVSCRSSRGSRTLGAGELFVDAYTTSLEADELLTEVTLPAAAGSRGAYMKLERRAGDFAVASVAVQVALDERGACREIGIGLGAAGLTPIKPVRAEATLRGQVPSAEVVQEAARQVQEAAQPLDDVRGTPAYKRAVARTLFTRALDVALRRCRGEQVKGGHA